jgi:polysaccharide export outer membrane protein
MNVSISLERLKAANRAFWWRVGIIFCCILVTACAQVDLPPLPLPQGTAYRLDTGDTVRVIVFNQQAFSTDYTVADDGTLSFPILGEIKARTLTVAELKQEIRAGLSNGVLKDPAVSVQLSQYRPFFVIGEVAKPGQYPYMPDLNALGAVAVAGGFSIRADEEHLSVLRKSGSGTATEWAAGPASALAPGDVLIVHEHFP